MPPAPALDIQAIEDVIRQALSAAKAQGLPIGPGSWGLHLSQGVFHPNGAPVCLVGASLLGLRTTASRSTSMGTLAERTFAARIGRPVTWVHHLIRAFDAGESYTETGFPLSHDAVTLGLRFRRESDAGLWGDPAHP